MQVRGAMDRNHTAVYSKCVHDPKEGTALQQQASVLAEC